MLEIKKVEQKKEYLPLLLLADPCEDMIDRYLPGGDLYVLFNSGRPVCEAVVVRLTETDCELKNIATQEEEQGKGYASQLIRYLFRKYGDTCKVMYVGTSEKGRSFYQRLGFQPSHKAERFFVDNYPEPIWEDGKQCVDMYYLKVFLHEVQEKETETEQKRDNKEGIR